MNETKKEILTIGAIREHPHHPAMSELVDAMCHRTGNVNREFFQAEVAYFLTLIPSAMRAVINSPERGRIPINMYVIALATSGFGKGHSVSLMEDVLSEFREEFTKTTLPLVAEKSLLSIANRIAVAKNSDPDEELEGLQKEYDKAGKPPWSFDSGTTPALKQLRHRLILSGIGAINFQMDEIGANLVANSELLNAFLELYDLGKIKTKLIKNTGDQERGSDLVGDTPANAMMFGTTSKLLDGAKIEQEFFDFLEMGYARRCVFGMGYPFKAVEDVSPEDVYRSMINKEKSKALTNWKADLVKFAQAKYFNRVIDMSDDVGVELVRYRMYCEQEAIKLPEHATIRRAELTHRYFKALKLAGTYAFIDESSEITLTNLKQALRLVEENGNSFAKLMNRERPFVRLAKYIADTDAELTHADLVTELPYYPTANAPRQEMMALATAWGVRNHVVIRRNMVSGVDFFSGESLEETDLNRLVLSHSKDMAHNYKPTFQPLDKLHKLLGAPDRHWCNHHFDNEHRSDDDTIPGFNMVVIDVDGGSKLKDVQSILSEYTYITATTKSHGKEGEDRFRLILPTNYKLQLDKEEYKAFMNSVLMWMPFDSDPAANQRSKKWMSFKGSEIKLNNGTALLDVLPFIPKTKLNDDFVEKIRDLGNASNLERWFITRMNEGNTRNCNLLNYAMMLKDSGMTFEEARDKVLSLNSRCNHPLSKSELDDSVFVTLGKKTA